MKKQKNISLAVLMWIKKTLIVLESNKILLYPSDDREILRRTRVPETPGNVCKI